MDISRLYALPCFDVRDFGAAPDTLCTEQVQAAIDACHAAGGGAVYFSGGVYLCGTLYLKSHVYLRVDADAVLLASGDISHYGLDTHYNRYVNEPHMDRCFLFAEDCEDIGLLGDGQINGNGGAFHHDTDRWAPRPMMVRFLRCRDITLHGLHLCDPAAWSTAFLDCDNIDVTHVTVRSLVNLNGDGFDFDNCTHVRVLSCVLFCSDDAICVQSNDRSRTARDIVISRCHISSYCAGIRIGMKSVGDIEDVTVQDCTMDNVWREGIKLESSEGGAIRNITVRRIVMRDVRRPLYFLANNLICTVGVTQMPAIGKIENVSVSDLTITDSVMMENDYFIDWLQTRGNQGTPQFGGIRIDTHENHPMENISLERITYRALGGIRIEDLPREYPKVLDALTDPSGPSSSNYGPGWSRASHMDIRNVRNLTLRDITLSKLYADTRPEVLTEGCTLTSGSGWMLGDTVYAEKFLR